mmetsp:Transcript_68653/g.164834  ORF Transcript_68653/g.164834 Transcript_68653/m.164834 type:complete len:747 (-) Transcript_68653:210-2450(-)|eukprot:CAMPEP_0178459894 /NCGR_PEP_ID=MMETSP0689_2-20121128/48388_1 /TAXON_ID=160604 /ORGANISM="Amphidinium massartii, Strain CS-259" /LENGTH=746 /DNA_ID=CAMNT_0020086431 /DNA_START=96 /DNA_END=2336 /DNA_ORIENTATION=-
MSTQTAVRPDGVGVITLNNAPVNSLSASLVTSFKREFPKLAADPNVKAIVVTGAGKFFCGGAEITEFALLTAMGPDAFKDQAPTQALFEMMDLMDGCPKTVVAALNGMALGGGLETALACHYRVAAQSAGVGFPEVQLGLLPGAQGTQRLPRVAPLPTAMQMMLMGAPVKAPQAKKEGIIDLIATGDVIEEAAKFALSKKPAPISKRPVPHGNRIMAAAGGLDQGMLMAYNQAPAMIAPGAIIRCLEAACSGKSFQEGLKVESQEFTQLLFGKQSAALRHLFFAERLASRIPGVKAEPAPIKKVGIVGAGLMGGGIAICFAQKGVPVVLKDAKQEWLDAGMKKISGIWESQAKRGRISADKLKQLLGLVKPTLDYGDFKDVDMVIEAVPEIMDLKKSVFKDLEASMRPDALICTNTSGLNIDDIATVLKDPSRVMGCHFFSPANVMQLLENVRTKHASDRTLATGMAMGKLISKKTVLAGNCDGFIGNRMVAPYSAEARMLIEEGATIEQVDKAATAFGMAMGPMALGDLVGLELFWKQRKALGDMKRQTKTYYGPYEMGDWLCELGRYGQKTPDKSIKADGRGIFIHRGRDKEVDPEVVAKIEEIRKTKGITARAISDEEIVERLFFPLVNEGFKILEEGHASKPSDIDIVYIFGYGFPPHKGGPMFWAENFVGFPTVLERVKVYNAQAKERFTKNSHYLPVDYFEPSKLLEECAAMHGTKAPPGQSLIDLALKKRKGGSKSSKL